MNRNDMLMFYRYLAKSKSYFEFGSGGSTYQASIRENIQRIISVESDFEWHSKVKSIVKSPVVQFVHYDIQVDLGNYLSSIQTYGDPDIDLILIGGLFRVACCLNCFDSISYKCRIAFDDFMDQPQYNIVLKYYDIIERTSDKWMVILRKKSVPGPSRELIETQLYRNTSII